MIFCCIILFPNESISTKKNAKYVLKIELKDFVNKNAEFAYTKNMFGKKILLYCLRSEIYNVDSICLLIAQSCIESGYGLSNLATETNNIYGITAGSKWKGKKVVRKSLELGEIVNLSFRAYNSEYDSFKDRLKLKTPLIKYSTKRAKYVTQLRKFAKKIKSNLISKYEL